MLPCPCRGTLVVKLLRRWIGTDHGAIQKWAFDQDCILMELEGDLFIHLKFSRKLLLVTPVLILTLAIESNVCE